MVKPSIRVAALVTFALAFGAWPHADRQTSAFDPATAPLTATLPADPAVTAGALPNGLRYYLRANARPAKRAELRLVVKAGSILEDDDQRGAAHLVEHMAFAGTAHFPGASLLSFLSALGTNLGRDLNGATGFHETIYKMQIPTDTQAVLDRGLTVLDDWSRAIQFDPAAFERERAVVIEEWRTRQTAMSRVANHGFEVMFAGSRYADRSPTGTEISLRALTPARVQQFYADWYRPDQMSVVAVGDFDPGVVEALVRQRFTATASSTPSRPRPTFAVPSRQDTTFDAQSAPEIPAQMVTVATVRPARDAGLVGSVRAAVVDGLVANAIVARLSDRARAADPPFISASVTRGRAVNHINDAVSVGALVNDGGFDRALDALLAEIRRVEAFGFSDAELTEQRAALTRAFEREVAEANSKLSSVYADEYARNAGMGEPIADPAVVAVLRRRFLASLARTDLAAVGKDWFSNGARFVMAVGRKAPGVPEPDVARLKAVAAASDARPIAAAADRTALPSLMTTLPRPGAIVGTSTIAPPGATVWTLSNGARVVLLPTTAKADEISFFATAPGGKSLASEADLGAATASILAANAGGLGQLTMAEAARALAGHTATATPSLGDFSTRLKGLGSRQDLETLFQVIHLRFAEPRPAPALFESGKSATRTVLTGLSNTPELQFADAVGQALSGNHPRTRTPTAVDIDAWRLESALAYYRERFADAGNFTFGFVGSFDLDTLRPLVERYLASLPGRATHETWRDTGVRTPDGIVERTIHGGTDPKARVAVVFTGPTQYDAAHRAVMSALGSIVQSRLFATIRNSLGGTYAITTASQIENVPVGVYKFRIQWECDPARVDELVQRVFAELEFIKNNPVAPAGLVAFKEGVARNLASATNTATAALLLEAYENGDNAGAPWRVVEALRTVTTADVMAAARTYFDTSRYVKVVMLPAER